jgi:hypothetical protein
MYTTVTLIGIGMKACLFHLLLTLYTVFCSLESVDRLMNETHELGGSTIAVDRATPKVIM